MIIGGKWLLFIAAVLVFGIGCWAAQVYDNADASHDASAIVIDEVAGQWLVLLVAPFTPLGFLSAFLLFRLFDIVKPWPVGWIDKNVSGGFGVMLDDVGAAIFAAVVLWFAVWIAPERFL